MLNFGPDKYMQLNYNAIQAGLDSSYSFSFQHGNIKNSPAGLISKTDGSAVNDVNYMRNGSHYVHHVFNSTSRFGTYSPSFPYVETFNKTHSCSYIKEVKQCRLIPDAAAFPKSGRRLSQTVAAYIGKSSHASQQTVYMLDGDMATVNAFKTTLSASDIFKLAMPPTPPPSPRPTASPTPAPQADAPPPASTIIGAAVGGAALLCCCLSLLFLWCRKRAAKRKEGGADMLWQLRQAAEADKENGSAVAAGLGAGAERAAEDKPHVAATLQLAGAVDLPAQSAALN